LYPQEHTIRHKKKKGQWAPRPVRTRKSNPN
jgi:hypothetical protein